MLRWLLMQVMTRSLAATASAAETQTRAPVSEKATVFSGDRFQMHTEWPFLMRHRAKADPMEPRPKTDTVAMTLDLQSKKPKHKPLLDGRKFH